MVLILNNQELESAIDMPSCVEALYNALKAYNRKDAARRPRIDIFAPTSRPDKFACFSSMEGIVRSGYYAIRIKPDIISWPEVNGVRRRVTYCYQPGLYGGLILVFRTENAELVAIMNDGYIQHMRVGATAALGARYLARANAGVVGMIGSGGMARSFALGFAAVRKLKKIKAYSPKADHLKSYCKEMSEKLGIEVAPVKNAAEAVKGSDIVASCTNSMEPVIEGRLLEPGMFVANVTRRELDKEVSRRVTLVGYLAFQADPLKLEGFSDDNFEIRANVLAYVAGQPEERQRIPVGKEKEITLSNARWVPCVDWETGKPIGRQSDEDITLLAELAGSNSRGLASSGIQGIQFTSVAGRAYELASARGLGKPLDRQLFLQDIPT
jgi:alanine dehydrogenase